MKYSELLVLARKIAELENDKNNILENTKIMESLIKDCTVEDLLKLDEIIPKYLTK
jgi:hypothetical protein